MLPSKECGYPIKGGREVLSDGKKVLSWGKNLGTLFISYSCGSSKGWLVQRGGRWGDVEQLS